MPELKPLCLEMQGTMNEIFTAENSGSADYCFGNFYMWDRRFKQYVAVVGNRLVTRLTRNGEAWFAFPVGSGDIAPAMDFMKEYCLEHEMPLKICGICNEHLPLLSEDFIISPDRDFSDYIYSLDGLSAYSGKHLHGKKNFCNRFEKAHEWSFEAITAETLSLCSELLEQWHIRESARLDDSIAFEDAAIKLALENYGQLGLEGGILFADGKPAGFSMGEVLNADIFCIHFEKAFSDMDGAYPMVCREMAKLIKRRHPDMRYVNREDDMGNLSLRKSKLSYKPEYILEKHTAIWQKNE